MIRSRLSAIGDGAHHNGYRLAGGSRYADISPVRINHCAMRFALAYCPLNQPHLAPALRTFEGVYLVAFRNRLRADNPPLHGANDTGLRAPHRTISFDVRQLLRAKHQRDRLDSQYGRQLAIKPPRLTTRVVARQGSRRRRCLWLPRSTVISASQRRAVERDFAGRETPTATRAMKSQSYPRASASMSTRRDGATDGAASMNGHATHRRRAEPGMTRSDTSCGRQYL